MHRVKFLSTSENLTEGVGGGNHVRAFQNRNENFNRFFKTGVRWSRTEFNMMSTDARFKNFNSCWNS